jgi:mRNA-degrading endonuclease RelE of RelBE toxin-antitoxin system
LSKGVLPGEPFRREEGMFNWDMPSSCSRPLASYIMRRNGLELALSPFENAPKQESKSRIKRLKGLRQPQYRLRVDRLRVFYDVNDQQGRVEVLGFVMKPEAEDWLKEHGVPE